MLSDEIIVGVKRTTLVKAHFPYPKDSHVLSNSEERFLAVLILISMKPLFDILEHQKKKNNVPPT